MMSRRATLTDVEHAIPGIASGNPSLSFMDEATFQQFALSADDRKWELYDGVPREKPGMSAEHNDVSVYLAVALAQQLDRRAYRVRHDSTHVRRSSGRYYIPDVFVVPTSAFKETLGRPGRLEVYSGPLPLVVEVWSRTTEKYDIESKFPEYQARGDLEIWRLHPYERTLTAWRRQPDGQYDDTTYRGGLVEPAFLPDVVIDLDDLFDFA